MWLVFPRSGRGFPELHQQSLDHELGVEIASRHLPARAFAGLVPSAVQDSELAIEVWIGREDALPRSVRMLGELVAGDPPDMTRLMTLRDFNAPVTVEPPL